MSPGCPSMVSVASPVEQAHGRSRRPRGARRCRRDRAWASSSRLAMVCSRRVPPSAPTMAASSRRARAPRDGQLRVALVLVRGMNDHLRAAGTQPFDVGGRERIGVTDDQVDSEAERFRLQRAAICGDDKLRAGGASSAVNHLAAWARRHRRRSGLPRKKTPFAGTNQIRFRGSAALPHSQRRSALPCPCVRAGGHSTPRRSTGALR